MVVTSRNHAGGAISRIDWVRFDERYACTRYIFGFPADVQDLTAPTGQPRGLGRNSSMYFTEISIFNDLPRLHSSNHHSDNVRKEGKFSIMHSRPCREIFQNIFIESVPVTFFAASDEHESKPDWLRELPKRTKLCNVLQFAMEMARADCHVIDEHLVPDDARCPSLCPPTHATGRLIRFSPVADRKPSREQPRIGASVFSFRPIDNSIPPFDPACFQSNHTIAPIDLESMPVSG